jgi:alpha-ketoglutarate-dependent taurine dioxygenase
MTVTQTPTETPVRLDVRKLSGTIGAEIRGVDLKTTLDPATVAAIRGALLDHKVIFFPGQHLDPDQHLAFAGHFGEITPAHPVIPGIDGHPEVFQIDYTLARQVVRDPKAYGTNSTWHTDVTFVERPPLGSILNAITIPESGGDTLFSDQRAAYEALSAPLRDLLDGLTAVHSGERQFGALLAKRKGGGEWEGEQVTELEPVSHPVVRTHPETGARSLFVNAGFTSHIAELTRAESDALLGFLYQHSTRPEFVVRYHWEAGDLGFWDNRVTQHSVVQDFGTQPRVIQRVTIRGDAPS